MNRVRHFQNQNYDKIKKNLEEQKSLFVDNVFPSTDASLGGAVETLTEAEQIHWKRPRDLCEEPHLVADGGSRAALKINGGKLASGWFMQALQILSGIKELLFKVIVNSSEQADFSHDNYIGLYRFRLWRYGEWVDVLVDDTLPCVNDRPLFTQHSNPAIFWPCLLEKAYAKLLGSYSALDEGHVTDALVDVTGGVTEVMDLRACDVSSCEDDRAVLYRTLNTELSQHSIVCASVPARQPEDMDCKSPEGIFVGHTYHVTALKKVHIQSMKLRDMFKGREKLAVIKIKDTLIGCEETLSEGSPAPNSLVSSPTHSSADSSPEDDAQPVTSNAKKTAWSRLKERDLQKLGLTVDAEGELWLPFEDFCRHFNELTIVRLYNHNLFTRGPTWLDSYHHDEWKAGERSGGGNSNSVNFFQNPQYLIDVKSHDEEIVFQLLQHGGKEPASAGSNVQPHKLLSIGLTFFLVEVNRKHKIHRLWGFTPKTVSVNHKRRREVTYRGTFAQGRYLLVPSAFRLGSEGGFLIRAISQNNIKFRAIKKDIPREPCGLSCIASPVVWVSVLSVKSAVGLPDVKDVFCVVKCERQTAKTGLGQTGKDIVTWSDSFVFYRRKPERLITVTVYAHNVIKRNQFLGFVELQGSVNHAATNLEVTLNDKEGGVFTDRTITVEILTEDDLMAV